MLRFLRAIVSSRFETPVASATLARLGVECLEGRVVPSTTPVEGHTWTGAVAGFRFNFPPADHVTAVIDWGDGKPPSTVDATPAQATGGPVLDWVVNGSHEYDHWGTYQLHVTAHDDQGREYDTTRQFQVAWAPVTLNAKPIQAVQGKTDDFVVATGTYDRPEFHQATTGDLVATIYWGYPTHSSDQVKVQVAADGTFTVHAPHRYDIPGSLPVQVNLAFPDHAHGDVLLGPAPSVYTRANVTPSAVAGPLPVGNTYDPATDPWSPQNLGLTPGATGLAASVERDAVLAAASIRDAFVNIMESPLLRVAVSLGGNALALEQAAQQQFAQSATQTLKGLAARDANQLAHSAANSGEVGASGAGLTPVPVNAHLQPRPNMPGFTVSYLGGYVYYGPTDGLARSTLIEAIISKEMITRSGARGFGTHALNDIIPPGYQPTIGNLFARGHLLAKLLGGAGDVPQNLVTLYQRAVNSGAMSTFEKQVANAVDAGKTIYYQVVPIYNGANPMPESLVLAAQSTDGTFRQALQIYNQAGGGTRTLFIQ